ncbi:MAG: DEAD/DEAH box helicase [Deltaproteobacteria bacterium]|nr:DEAD/DEAH box helicase [Deltaproteobacteria bacterium]
MSSDEQAFSRPVPPWSRTRGLDAVLEQWRGDGTIVLDHVVPGRDGRYAPIPERLHPGVAKALRDRGISQLYAHQAESFEVTRVRDASEAPAQHLVVATPTASGKSLCYNLSVLDALAKEPDARALYLFPTKALSRDQEAALRELMRESGIVHGAITYDGDTPGDARRAARERSCILLTNPDMLHAGILPHHASWARFFSNLRYVVIDELHTYRGVFGSHLANVIRRLTRIAKFHGQRPPTFIFASATIGNPKEHASRMVGSDVHLVRESGAPTGDKHVLMVNPPVLNAELGVRASYTKTAVSFATDLVRAEVPTLVFGQSRNQVEVMLKYLRDRLIADKVDPELIQGYRSGYLPETRRRIEQGLRAGTIRCVVATNALELGIDIGSLSAVVCAGYPGTIAALWQRFGRAGRRSEPSLALLVASSMPLDQYVATHADLVTGAPVEHARIDPDNVEILVQHLKCAAFELPFESGEQFGDVPAQATQDGLEYLATHGVVHAAPSPGVGGAEGKTRYHWSTDAYPASHVSLRSVSWDNFVIVDLDTDKTIAEMDWRATHTMLHVQAIYQHDAEQYQVERLDFENHKAFVRKVAPDYYTTAMTYTRVSVTQEDDAAFVRTGESLEGVAVGLGEVSVIEKVVGYKKIKFNTHENVGYGDVRLPEMQMHTSAVWITFAEDTVRSLAASDELVTSGATFGSVPRAVVVDAVRGIGHAMHTVAAVGLMCDPRDLGHVLAERSGEGEHPQKGDADGAGFDPTIFVYDHIPGGVGLAPRLFADREIVLRRTRALIEDCPCQGGCPACIGVVMPPQANAPLVDPDLIRRPTEFDLKRVAIELLARVGVSRVH